MIINSLLKKLSVFKNETILNCLKKLNSTNKQFVYVKDNEDKLIGILTDADVRRALLKKKNYLTQLKIFITLHQNLFLRVKILIR